MASDENAKPKSGRTSNQANPKSQQGENDDKDEPKQTQNEVTDQGPDTTDNNEDNKPSSRNQSQQSKSVSRKSVLSRRRLSQPNDERNTSQRDGNVESRISVKNSPAVSQRSKTKLVDDTLGDDEWSDIDHGEKRRSNSLATYKPPYSNRRSRNGMCSCLPDVSGAGISSMLYEQNRCKHYHLTGYTHSQVKKFDDNWDNPGLLPPIHHTNFVAKRDPMAQRAEYTVSMGYPPHGGIKLEDEADDEEDDSDDSDDESDDTVEEEVDNNQQQENTEIQRVADANIRNQTSNSTRSTHSNKNKFLTKFPYTPRVMVSEERYDDGYLAEDEIYDMNRNKDVQSRIKKGRGHIGKVFDPITGKMKEFEIHSEGNNLKYDRQTLRSANVQNV